jgi:integrase
MYAMPIGDFPAEPLEPSEALALVRRQSTKSRTGTRNRAIFGVLWRCGLRNGELRNLDLSHVSHEGEALRITRPKGYRNGKKPRTVGVDQTTMALIDAWIEHRGTEPGPLFITYSGRRITGRDLRDLVATGAKLAGIARRVHPHCLRHTYARALYDEGVGMVHIQKALGHTNLATTAVYLDSIGATEVVAITSNRTWEV